MKLFELFSPIGGPSETDTEEIDWIGDLKAFIDDHEDLLGKEIMPAVSKHQKYIGHPRAYKIYIKPIKKCAEEYCNTFELDQKKIFTPEMVIKLAKQFANQQNEFIQKGDYNVSQ